jgi:hypothetical protein
MFICYGQTRKRFVLACSRFFSPEEIFNKAVDLYQRGPVSLEYGPNLFQLIETELELQFVCKLVSGDHSSYISDEDYTQHLLCVEESQHTDAYEKELNRGRSRKQRARNGRAARKKNNDITRDGRHDDSRHRGKCKTNTENESCHAKGSVEIAAVDAEDITEQVASVEPEPVVHHPWHETDSSHDEWPNSTDWGNTSGGESV